jgi:hypothetical protein
MARKISSDADIRQMSRLISNLLSHYWMANEPVEVRERQITDWLEDLAEFGPEIVSIACGRWRRQPGGRRPTPGDIHAICVEETAARGDDEPVAASSGKKSYAEMTDAEKWVWHTDVYAFRRVVLGINAHYSPVDRDGRWYDVALVDAAEAKKRDELGSAASKEFADREAFAHAIGWPSWLARQDSIDRHTESMQLGLAWQSENAARRAAGFVQVGGAAEVLGVTAREWTAEEMARGRAELGLADQQPESPP